MSNKLKILYVEDDKEVASSVARTISLCSDIDSIHIANDGEEALKLFDKEDFDLVISDIQMPKLNGLDAIKKIKEKNPDLYTIITTAFNEKDYLLNSIDSGVDKYLLKPLDLNKLIDLINTYYEEKKIKKETEHKNQMLLLEAKASSLEYMIDAIAHQWKQPLGVISLLNSNIQFQLENKTLKIDKIKECTVDISNSIDHMVVTMDEFKSMVKTNREKKEFSIKQCLKKVQNIIKLDLSSKKIFLKLNIEDDFLINGFENQFIHIILNFISNSLDAFEAKKIDKKEIKIYSKDNPYAKQLIYEDNAGGIPDELIGKIFQMGISSKSTKNNSGMGLYLCSQIAFRHHAEIEVENISGGVRFVIKILKD